MANTKITKNWFWYTFHNLGNRYVKQHLATSLVRSSTMSDIEKYNDATAEIRNVLQGCIDRNERFRAIGASWSMNTITYNSDNIQTNDDMNLKWHIDKKHLHKDTGYDASNLFFFQCGIKIKTINNYLKQFNKSLKTSGASNGQSIAGCISTGVHCSAIDVGSIQDAVVGLQLIIGPNKEDVIYLERASKPALSDNYIKQLNARIIRDDKIFNAALVGLGAFGFIHGVVMETEDIYLLKRYTKYLLKREADAFVQKLSTPTTSNNDYKTGIKEIDDIENGVKPFHYKLYINPYNKHRKRNIKRDKSAYMMEIMYKKPYRSNYRKPNTVDNYIYTELIDIVISIASKKNNMVPGLINLLKRGIFPKENLAVEGTHGDIFTDTKYQGPAFGIAFGVDIKDYEKGVDTLIRVANTAGPVPGALGIRFVKGSEATLAFTKYPLTCIVEMDGLRWEDTKNIISLKAFEKALFDDLKRQGINFTLHWGKNTAWDYPGLIDYMFDTKDDEWVTIRSKLLSKQMCDIFSNDFLATARLAGYTNPDIVV